MKKKDSDQSKALRDEGMRSPGQLRNTTAPRKVKDMPEDEGYKTRNPDKDYEVPIRKVP
jgi:hypothetical protein